MAEAEERRGYEMRMRHTDSGVSAVPQFLGWRGKGRGRGRGKGRGSGVVSRHGLVD